MSKYGDLDVSITQFEERVWSVRSDETPLNKEACLYTVPPYLEVLFDGRKRSLCDLENVKCVHGRFLSRCVTQAILASQPGRQLIIMSAPHLECVQLNRGKV